MLTIGCVAPLFVPGDRPERFVKAAASGADAIIIDLEDAVPTQNKDRARASLAADFTQLPIFVRINAADTLWHDADVAAALSLPIQGLVIPKVELGNGLSRLTERQIPLLPLIETARGLSQAREIASVPGVARLIFGSIDYCADLGIAHERDCLLSARSELVFASRLARIEPPIDGVTTALNDAAVTASDAAYSRKLGFTGKLAIHPRQVSAIIDGFTPDEGEVAWARKVLATGNGAVSVDHMMVDEPVRIRARRILHNARILA